jgi:hypothetical protein
MVNLFRGFSEFAFKGDDDNQDKSKYVSTVKKQLSVPKQVWMGMPLLISNTKIGKQMITTPTMFYVTDFDDSSVTLTNVPKPGEPDDIEDEDDPDNEIDLDKQTIKGRIEFTISKEDFESLQEPQTFQGMDTMSLRVPGSGGF